MNDSGLSRSQTAPHSRNKCGSAAHFARAPLLLRTSRKNRGLPAALSVPVPVPSLDAGILLSAKPILRPPARVIARTVPELIANPSTYISEPNDSRSQLPIGRN